MTHFRFCAMIQIIIENAMTERVHSIDTLQRTFRQMVAETDDIHLRRLRGMGQELWNMASEQRTEQVVCKIATGPAGGTSSSPLTLQGCDRFRLL